MAWNETTRYRVSRPKVPDGFHVQLPALPFSMTVKGDIPAGNLARLRLLATSDLHMHLMGYDYYADRPDNSVGLVQTASLIHMARREAKQNDVLTLLFDNGDSLQGTPMGDLAARNTGQAHPLMRAFEHLHYDAIGLGNHDFNFGLETLLSVLADAPCPVLCSNLRRENGSEMAGIAPYAILDRSIAINGQSYPIRVGVLSFLPPQTVQWDTHHLRGYIAVDDIIQSAPDRIRHLKEQRCDVIVALAHSGLDDATQRGELENAIVPLAALAGIDAVIAGHTHLLLPGKAHEGLQHVNASTGDVHGKPVVMPGSAGSHLGVIDLRLEVTEEGQWSVHSFDCALRPIAIRENTGTLVPSTPPDRTLVSILAPDHRATRASMLQPVGRTNRSLHSYFSFIAPDRSLALVAAAQAAALRPLLEGTEAGKLPLLSAAAPCKFGGRSGPLNYTDVPKGNVSLRHAADLHVFPNELCAVIVTGQQIHLWLEQSSALFLRIDPGSNCVPLTDTSVPGHDFDVLHGVTWQIDLSVAPQLGQADTRLHGGRISDIRLDGELILPDQRFVVALNNYRANGGGNFQALCKAEPLALPRLNIRDVICDYLSGSIPADSIAGSLPAWRFKPMPGTIVTIRTGPGARAYLNELADREIVVSGPGADGFLRLTLGL